MSLGGRPHAPEEAPPGPDVVHLWYTWTAEARDPALLERCRALLSAGERERLGRFHFERDRHLYLVAHALVRSVLSLYAHVPPEAWTFVEGPRGRPAVSGPEDAPRLDFNLAHTRGLAVVGVTSGTVVGVDAEDLTREIDLDVARRFFSPAEVEGLLSLPEERRAERFFSLWTLKEAYVKAVGGGLGIPLRGFTIHLEGKGEPPRISFEDDGGEDPARWHLFSLPRGAHHRVAVAVRGRRGRPPTLLPRPTGPLGPSEG